MNAQALIFAPGQAVVLALPYPLSANRYWTSFRIGNRQMVAPSKEAKAYKTEVAWLCKQAGIRSPLIGRVSVDIALYPQRPQDWAKRVKDNPTSWDDTVRCIDLDNARKVLYDALKDLAFQDDKWVWQDSARRMQPDGDARVVVTIRPWISDAPQASLFGAHPSP